MEKYQVIFVMRFFQEVTAESEMEAKYKALEKMNSDFFGMSFVPSDITTVEVIR